MRVHWHDSHMSPAKWARAVGLIVATFVGVYFIAKPLMHAYVLAHPRRWPAELTPEQAGRPVERVTLTSTDGLELAGWFVSGGSGATVVVSHGSGANGASAYGGVAFLVRAGYNVLVFDHRAHGQSGGAFTTLGPNEVRDMLGAVAYVRGRPDVDAQRVVVMGCSMGSAVSIAAAAADPTIRAVVAEAVYADMGELWDRFAYIGIRDTPLRWRWGGPLRWATWLWTGERVATFKPEALIAHIAPRPVLIIHGARDNAACTVGDAERLFRAAHEPKELWIVPGAGHCAAHAMAGQAYEERILGFLESVE